MGILTRTRGWLTARVDEVVMHTGAASKHVKLLIMFHKPQKIKEYGLPGATVPNESYKTAMIRQRAQPVPEGSCWGIDATLMRQRVEADVAAVKDYPSASWPHIPNYIGTVGVILNVQRHIWTFKEALLQSF